MSWDTFFPPMAGSLVGVIVGIIANYIFQRCIVDNENKEKYKKMIKSEIGLCIHTLERHDLILLLPLDRWTSAINYGALKLFDVERELGPLSTAYQWIKDYDNFITVEQFNGGNWDVLEIFNTYFATLDWQKNPENAKSHFPNKDDFSKMIQIVRLLKDRKSLLDELRVLYNAEWLKASNEPTPGYNDAFRYEVNERH